MLDRLDFWLAMLTLGLLAYFELGKYLAPIVRPIAGLLGHAATQGRETIAAHQRARHLRSQPIRDARGRFDGSLPAVPVSVPAGNSVPASVPASESEVPSGNDVPPGTLSPTEAALIGLRLGRGMAPGAVAKSLPGYSGRKYQEYLTKVNQVQAELAGFEPDEVTPAA